MNTMITKESLAEYCKQKHDESKIKLSCLRGKAIRIISNYNGQVHGSSKKSLKGTMQTINHAFESSGELVVWIDNHQAALLPHDWEFA